MGVMRLKLAFVTFLLASNAAAFQIPERKIPPSPFVSGTWGFEYRLPRSRAINGNGRPSFSLLGGYEFLGNWVFKVSAEGGVNLIRVNTLDPSRGNTDLAVLIGTRIAHVPQPGDGISHYLPPIFFKGGLALHNFSGGTARASIAPYLGGGIELGGRRWPLDLFAEYTVHMLGGEPGNLSGFDVGLRFYFNGPVNEPMSAQSEQNVNTLRH